MYGNLNTTFIGDDWANPKVRLPGSGGGNDVASLSLGFFIIMRETKRNFVENVNFIRSAIAAGLPELIPMLFVGKIAHDDIPVLYEHYLEGIIEPPKYLPKMFRDLNGLYVWFGFSNGMGLIDMKRVRKHFLKSFAYIKPVCPIEMAPKGPVYTDPQI